MCIHTVLFSQQQSSRQSRLRPLPSQPKPHSSPRPPPLPSRTNAADIYDVPPSHTHTDIYDVPPNDPLYDHPPSVPAEYEIPPSLNNGPQVYSVPIAARRTSSPAEMYSVPTSSQKMNSSEVYSVPVASRKTSSPDTYSVPPSRQMTRSPELYSVPTSRGKTSSPELYSVPTSRGKSSPELYSVPQSIRKTAPPAEIYDVPPTKSGTSRNPSTLPPRLPVLGSSQGGLNYANGQGGNEMYDIPPPRLLSAQPNPEIPPPRLPRRTNTAPSSGTNKSSSLL